MNFIRKLFPTTCKKNIASDTKENNNVTRETFIDQWHAPANDSNKLESCVTINIEEDYTTNHDCSVQFNSDNIFHNLENFTPIEINPNDNTHKEPIGNEINDNVVSQDDTSLNNATDTRLVEHVLDDETIQTITNHSNLKQIQLNNETEASNIRCNTKATFNNDIDVETMQSLKEFEEALNNINKTVLTDEFGTELINLDDFNDIFVELDTVNEDIFSVKTVVENNDRETYCMENEITDANKNKINSNIGNIDIISINSSTEDEKSQTGEIKNSNILVSDKSDSDDGYNSSDFEFISETEANMDGFIINFRQENSEPISRYSGHYIDEEIYQGKKSDPGEGPSRQNNPRNEFEDRSYRNNHHIPVGDDYLDLFQGIYNPLLPMFEIHFLENKSVRASAMNSQYDGIGFDRQLALRRHQPDSSEDEFEYEAKQSAKKILSMYPRENRKRRRRH